MVPSLIEAVPASWHATILRALYGLPKPVRTALAGRPIYRDGQRLDPDMQLLLRLIKLSGRTLSGYSPMQARAMVDWEARVTAGRTIPEIDTREVAIPGQDGVLPGRLYTPTGLAEGSGLLVFYHGGGWVVGGLDSHDNACRFLASKAGARVLSVGYRLAPEHPFPAAVIDALAAFDYATKDAETLGADPNLVAVGGDSAGANLAAVVCQQSAVGGGPKPMFALLFYPGTDATVRRPSREMFADGFFLTDTDLDWFASHYLPDRAQGCDPRCSVLLAEGLDAFPPTYVVTAGFDPLRDEGEEFAERLATAGVPVIARRHPDLIHGFLNFLGIGNRSREATEEAANTLRASFARLTV